MAVRAHAKINLELRVLGVRPDGYHELRTIFQSIALHDTLVCAPHDAPLSLTCDRPDVPLDRTNLIWRAADALWSAIGRDGCARGARVHLDKRIPMQAGLGGGSSDAAAALRGLAAVWGASVEPAGLTAIAATLGADVPFFLSGATALGLGRGDQIHPLPDLPRHWVVLLLPAFGVSTARAFGWYDAGRHPDAEGRPIHESQAVANRWPTGQTINDLEAPVARHHPEIDEMTTALRRAGAVAAAMTGSGSTVFGLFPERREAEAAARRLEASPWRVLLTRSLGRDAYERRSRPVPLRR